MIISDLKNFIAAYTGRNTVNDLTLNGLDTGLIAINAARRKVERAHDFYYSRIDANLSLGSSGASTTDAYISGSLTISGTISPNIAGTFSIAGTHNSAPFYTAVVSTVTYFLFFTGTAWKILAGGFTGANSWLRLTTSLEPAGTYNATGGNSGTLTVTSSNAALQIKRIEGVNLPVAGGQYVPIEFLTSDQWNDRLQRQIGRTTYDSTKTLDQLGASERNPIAYQIGQTIKLAGSGTFTYPIIAQLNCYRFMPDYTADSDHDFFCDFAPEFLQWAAILELNKFWRKFVNKQESNLDETSVQAMADEAMQTLLTWDKSVTPTTTYAPQAPKGK